MVKRQRKFKSPADKRRFAFWTAGKAIVQHQSHDDWLAERARLAAGIQDLEQDGKVAVVYGFRDCDMAVSDGNVKILPASVVAVNRWLDGEYENAEGPFWWNIVSPSDAEKVERTSRDLALEAFEDGHPHVVYT